MRGIYDGYSKVETNGKVTYFAGGNTQTGFVGSYGEIANENELDRIYIIKGGPGTGKSTLMKKAAKCAEEAGYTVRYYLCGSDNSSLDCVVIDGRLAILDGTAPHVREMTYPGAKSELIDVSAFWNSGILEARKEQIISSSALKSAEYASAYRYLKAVSATESELNDGSRKLFDAEKAKAYINRFIKNIGKPKRDSAEVSHIYTHAITMLGAYRVDTLRDISKMSFAVNDVNGIAVHFMELMKNTLESAGYTLTVGHIPIGGHVSGIYIHDANLSITVGEKHDGDKNVNMARFILDDGAKQNKGKIRLAAKCREECMSEALISLGRASVHHFALEEIYRGAMDFDGLMNYVDKIESDILSRLEKWDKIR